MDTLSALASALPPPARNGFLQTVANKLAGYPAKVRGPGLVHRLATEAQRSFLNVAVGDATGQNVQGCSAQLRGAARDGDAKRPQGHGAEAVLAAE